MCTNATRITDLSDWGNQTVRIAIVSDTHGFIDSRIAQLVESCHAAIHAGDIGSRSVLDAMKPQSRLVFAVAGNNDDADKWIESEAEFVDSLPTTLEIVLANGTICVEHGHTVRDTRRYHEILRKRHPKSRVIVYGHTHVRVIDQEAEPWVVNPGASGRVRTRGGASCLVLEAKSSAWTVVEHHFPK